MGACLAPSPISRSWRRHATRCFRLLPGFAIGTIIGLALGIAFGISDTLNRLMEVTVEAIRPIPSIALLPIALISARFRLPHGNRDRGVCLRLAGPDPLPRRGAQHRAAADGGGAGVTPAAGAAGLKIIIPAALPRIFVAFRLSAGIALIVAVTVEIAINPLGLGAGIMAGAAGAAPRPDAGLSGLDRHHRLRAEHPSDRGPEPPVRPRRVERRRPMNRTVIIWRVRVLRSRPASSRSGN